MFSLLCDVKNDFTHYFNVESLRGQMLISTICIFAFLLIAGVVLHFITTKKFSENKKKIDTIYLITSVAIMLIFAFVTIGLFISSYLKDVSAGNDYLQTYQTNILIATAVTLVVGLALAILFINLSNKTQNEDVAKKYKLGAKIIGIALVALTLILVIVSAVFNPSKEELSDKAKTLMIASIVTAVLSGIVLMLSSGKKSEKGETLAIVYAAISIAMSFALSYIRILKLPQGGSITIGSILPIVIYSYFFGVKRGVFCCLIYGLMQAMQDPWIVHPLQFILDYPLAFAMYGFAGLFRKMKPIKGLPLAILTVTTLRYLCHATSGAIFFGAYGADYGITNAAAWGFCYNLFTYADAAIAMILGAMLMSSKQIVNQLVSLEQRVN
ncbi:MAG: energy-coupled thiamine transporter ThiT [Clostridia bacterium]